MRQSRIFKQPACAFLIVIADQNAARQDAERAFQHAHVLVEHKMLNIGAIEQRAHR
jgi:hypothetical protein